MKNRSDRCGNSLRLLHLPSVPSFAHRARNPSPAIVMEISAMTSSSLSCTNDAAEGADIATESAFGVYEWGEEI